MTQASDIPPILYELPHELRGVRVCLRPYAVGEGIAMQEAIGESRDHLRPWMAWTDSRRTVQECGTVQLQGVQTYRAASVLFTKPHYATIAVIRWVNSPIHLYSP